ncbi:MAG: cytochrome b561 domain-containing protein [Smithellaceae bacterium]|nr:cytochrome b561 domain-containing protein [Smithellaceae bacterium]
MTHDATPALVTHAGLMITAFLLASATVIVARYQRKRRWWLKIHRQSGALAAIIALPGLIAAITYVAISEQPQFDTFHAYWGVGTIATLALTPFLGWLQFTVGKTMREKIRTVHRWIGRLALLLLITGIVTGLIYAGAI